MRDHVAEDYWDVRTTALSLLNEESKLEEIVKLVGPEALSIKEKLVLLTAKSIREDFLYQDSFDKVDAYTPSKKQYQMLKTIVSLYTEGLKLASKEDFDFGKVEQHPVVQSISKVRQIEFKDGDISGFEAVRDDIRKAIASF
jgi:V/A-type H+-transporting ATPase subunit A